MRTRVESPLYGGFGSVTHCDLDNAYTFELRPDATANRDAFELAYPVRLIEPGAATNHESIATLFSRVASAGGQKPIREMLPSVLDGAKGLLVLAYDAGGQDRPIVHVEFADYTVPLAAAGSGVYSVVRLALELSVLFGGVAIIEEPEVHQHPAAIVQTAKVLLAAARRNVQLFVSTHSLDLIDALVTHADEEDLTRLSVQHVTLDGGTLRSSRYTGPMVRTARGAIDEDLR